jgi:hypothetical protein
VKSPFPQALPKRQNLVYTLLKKPAIIISALAASLLVLVYQNAVVYPHLESQLAELHAPEILPALSLAGSNSRGDTTPTITVKAARPYLLSVDIPTDDRFSSYSCELQSASGEIIWRIPVAAEAAKDQVTIHAPASLVNSGRYTLVIRGSANAASGGDPGAGSKELARDVFDVAILH